MPILGVYSWSQYTTPTALSATDLSGDTHPNDPASPGYTSSAPSWIGETFTFNGGTPSQIDITDDDGNFEDAYVETETAQTLTSAVTIDGTVYPAGSVVENEFSLINASGQEIYVVRINGENVGFAYGTGDTPTVGETFTATQGLDGSPFDNAGGMSSSSEPYADIVCFARGTQIKTPNGLRLVETLKAGELVLTADHGAVPILWRRENEQPLIAIEESDRPVLIAAGALGPNVPTKNLIVSPQHRILVGSKQLGCTFGDEVFVPAKALTCLPGIRHMNGKRAITWVHFACQSHEIVIANGCLTESLLLGPMVMTGLSSAERATVNHLFGPSAGEPLNGPAARPILTVQEARAALRAHQTGHLAAHAQATHALFQRPQHFAA